MHVMILAHTARKFATLIHAETNKMFNALCVFVNLYPNTYCIMCNYYIPILYISIRKTVIQKHVVYTSTVSDNMLFDGLSH